MLELEQTLRLMADESYRLFHSRLIPTVDPNTILGVRVPKLRSYAKQWFSKGGYADFLQTLPHRYYEENMLHAFLTEQIRDFRQALAAVNLFLPYVDNWAVCDCWSPRAFAGMWEELVPHVRVWMQSDRTYTVRYGIGMMMRYGLDEAFSDEYPALVASVRSGEYYIRMMVAWYFATALAKQQAAVLPYFTEHRLDPWTHNKAIQKAVESNRISVELKNDLKTLKRRDV